MSPEVTDEAFSYAAEVCGWSDGRLPVDRAHPAADLRRGDAGPPHLPARHHVGHPRADRALRGRRDRHRRRGHANGDAYLVAFRLPGGDRPRPGHRTPPRSTGRRTRRPPRARRSGCGCWRTGPEAHRVEGEIRSKAPYVMMAVADALVLAVGLWWVQRRPPPPDRADPRQQPPRAGRPRRARLARASARRRATRPSARSCRPTTPRSSSTSVSAGWSSRWPATRTPSPSVPPPAPAVPSSADRSAARPRCPWRHQ